MGRARSEGGRARWPVLVLVIAVVLVGGALVADVVLRDMAEDRAAEEVSRVLDAPADVRIEGTLAGLRLLTGRVPTAHVTATDVPLEGAPVDAERLELVLTDVRVGIDDLRGRTDTLPDMGAGRFEARIGEDAVAALIRAPREIASVRLVEGGAALRVGALRLAADARAVDGNVVFVSRARLLELLGAEIALDLSGQPGSPYVEEVETTPEAMVIRGRLDEFGSGGVAGDGEG